MNLSLKNIIEDVSWSDIEAKMLSIYPEEEDSLHFYKRLYWELINLEPDENPLGLKIEFELFDEEDEVFYDTENYDTEFDMDDFMVGLTTEQWRKFLGYHVSGDMLKDLDKAEIITHAFLESNYGGFLEAENKVFIHPLDND